MTMAKIFGSRQAGFPRRAHLVHGGRTPWRAARPPGTPRSVRRLDTVAAIYPCRGQRQARSARAAPRAVVVVPTPTSTWRPDRRRLGVRLPASVRVIGRDHGRRRHQVLTQQISDGRRAQGRHGLEAGSRWAGDLGRAPASRLIAAGARRRQSIVDGRNATIAGYEWQLRAPDGAGRRRSGRALARTGLRSGAQPDARRDGGRCDCHRQPGAYGNQACPSARRRRASSAKRRSATSA